MCMAVMDVARLRCGISEQELQKSMKWEGRLRYCKQARTRAHTHTYIHTHIHTQGMEVDVGQLYESRS
jgi:hypothetical protein